MNKKTNLIITILGVLLIISIGYIFHLTNNLSTKNVTDTRNSAPKKSYEEATNEENIVYYVSPKLGIKFKYNKIWANTDIAVKEVENKIYLYTPNVNSDTYESGQYVEVFTKDPTKTLEQALQTQFLNGYDNTKCEVTKDTVVTQSIKYTNSYVVANIKVAGDPSDVEEIWKLLEDCPKPYTQSNGVSYFLEDTNHPDKFVFFSIGQYAISVDEQNVWQDTIEFLD